ncbi:MAG: class I SAM-dependent DNA methyltransferase [Candidatus Marinarcus sp.]|uniref:class I SAM-dependent DNA methyltransferase n=1 Tax=Candidatus Marinarcus sp. TaxID=3100987 RepID=UPI003AFF84EF
MNRFDIASKNWDQKPLSILIAKSTAQEIQNQIDLTHMDILDYGCGTGLLGFALSDNAHSLLGMDDSKGMVEVFNQKAQECGFENVKAIQHNINDQSLPKKAFDMIVISMALHHIKEINSFFKQCQQALKPNGYLCISDLDKEDGTFHAKHNNDGVEHFGFSEDEIKSLYQENGFELICLKPICTVEREIRNYPIFLSIGKI